MFTAINESQSKETKRPKLANKFKGFHVSSVQFVVFKDQGLQPKTASVSVLMFVITVAF